MVRSQNISADDVARIGSRLKFVGKHGVGVDNIDVKGLRTKGVTVMNTPGVNVSADHECAH